MAKRIHSFNEYLNEQEKKKEEPPKTGGDAYMYAKSLFGSILGDQGFKDNDFSSIADTKETKGGLPYTGCGTEGYKFEPSDGTNKQFIDLFLTGPYSKQVEYADITRQLGEANNKKIFLLGIREKLDVKKSQGDKFIDKIAIVDPNKPTEKVVSYQITTCPSVIFYGNPANTMNQSGVAIMQPGVTKYKVGIHRKGKPGEHEALVQAGEMVICRYPLNTKDIQTYKPNEPEKGANYGINIHRSSQQRGVCVGPWSAGCQVFSDGTEFLTFMNTMKAASANGGEFLYVLMEKDKFEAAAPAPAAGVTTKDTEKEQEASEEKNSEFSGLVKTLHDKIETFGYVSRPKFIEAWNNSVKSQDDANRVLSLYKKTYKDEELEKWFTSDKMSEKHLKEINFKPS